MTDERSRPSLPRLAQSDPALAELFRVAESEYRRDLDESGAYHRLSHCLAGVQPTPGNRRRLPIGKLLSVAAIAAGFMLGWFGWQRARSVTASPVAAPPSAIASVTSLRLAPGKSRLADGTVVDLAGGAEGILLSDERRSTLSFGSGHIEVVAAHQAKGRHLAVQTQGFEFRVIGTRFTVDVVGPRVSLDVTEGRVGVHGPNRTPTVVEAGGHWSNLDEPTQPEKVSQNASQDLSEEASPGAPGEASGEAPTLRSRPPAAAVPTKIAGASSSASLPNDLTTCRDRLAAGEPRHAEDCYRAMAAGSGLSAEMALYEIARLRRDVLSNPEAALDALDEYRTRFAAGTLSPEVQMARIDVLSRLGRVEEALQASQAALDDPRTGSRRSELRLLRGNLMRDRLHDCARAIAEYRTLEGEVGPRSDQAQFASASCLETLGRNAEAIATYRKYLERPNPRQAERARRRLKEIEP